MLNSLKHILEIQELDMKMLRLMRLKKERQLEMEHIHSLRNDLEIQRKIKEEDISLLAKKIQIQENSIVELKERYKQLEGKQGAIKRVDEFNALTQEMSSTERERVAMVQNTSDLIDKKNMEEEILEKIKESLASSEESSQKIEAEIRSSIEIINHEGKELKEKRDALILGADKAVLEVYERLLNNKRDRVVVPIENRTCNGCHIALTAHHENLVRKGERLIFCEHCSRILYWPEVAVAEDGEAAVKRRRRRKVT